MPPTPLRRWWAQLPTPGLLGMLDGVCERYTDEDLLSRALASASIELPAADEDFLASVGSPVVA